MKKIIALITLFVGFSAHAAVELTWQNLTQGLLNESGSVLTGSKTDSSVGFFLQLIRTDGDGIDAIDLSNVDGVSSGDTLIDSSYVGFGAGFAPADGNHSKALNYTALNTGDTVYIRAWNAASPNFGSDHAPIALNGGTATHYGNSITYTLTSSPIQDFNGSSIPSFQTNIAVVPEPGTFAIALMGGVVLISLRRKFRK